MPTNGLLQKWYNIPAGTLRSDNPDNSFLGSMTNGSNGGILAMASGLAAANFGALAMATPTVAVRSDAFFGSTVAPVRKKKKPGVSWGGYGKRWRARGVPAPPKRHPNRNHISRRVRRRHRRAKRA